VSISLAREGFRNSLTAPARRTAVGITHSGKLVIAAINRSASLHDIARLMVKVGARDALCLDGGSSTGFYHEGRYFAVPGRKLTNCLVIYSARDRYLAARNSLAPERCFARAEPQPLMSSPSLSFDLPLFSMRTTHSPEVPSPMIMRASW
jgi:hypothetical protein